MIRATGKIRSIGSYYLTQDIYLNFTEGRFIDFKNFIDSTYQRDADYLKLSNSEETLYDHFRDYLHDWHEWESDLEFAVMPEEALKILDWNLSDPDSLDAFQISSDMPFTGFGFTLGLLTEREIAESLRDPLLKSTAIFDWLKKRQSAAFVFNPAMKSIFFYVIDKYIYGRRFNDLSIECCDGKSGIPFVDRDLDIINVRIDADPWEMLEDNADDVLGTAFEIIKRAYGVIEDESSIFLETARDDLGAAERCDQVRSAYERFRQELEADRECEEMMFGAGTVIGDNAIKDTEYFCIYLTLKDLKELGDAITEIADDLGLDNPSPTNSKTQEKDGSRFVSFVKRGLRFNIRIGI